MSEMDLTSTTELKLTLTDTHVVGVDDYNALSNHPHINGVEVVGGKSLDEYDIKAKSEADKEIKDISDILANHRANKSNPHEVTKAQIGLGVVDNTADADKRVKYAQSAGNSATVNNHTVAKDVPANAVFTDTTYTAITSEQINAICV